MKGLFLLAMVWVLAGKGLTAQVADGAGYMYLGAYQYKSQHALQANANAALLPQYKTFTATIYGEKRFLLDDLSLVEAGVVMPVAEGGFGLQASSFGSALYNENKIGLAYGRLLGPKVAVGVQFNYRHHQVAGYGSAGRLGADAGFLYLFSESLVAGLQLINVAGTSSRYLKKEETPKGLEAGIGYAPSEAFNISTRVNKMAGRPVQVQGALQYRVLQELQATLAVETGTSTFYFGAGYQLSPIWLEAAASWHPHLGISPGIMITFKKKGS